MNRTYWAICILLLLATCGISAWFYPELPDRVPTHWNIRGEVDGWGSKNIAVFLMPAMMAGMLALFALIPWLSPKQFEVDSFRPTYNYIVVLTLALFVHLHAVILLSTWQEARHGPRLFDIGRALVGGILLFIGLIGNVMGKVRRNFYVGIKVPWTLASERVWNDTHRLAARLMVLGGILGFIVVATGLPIPLAIGFLVVSTVIPVIYSFVHYKSLERRGAL